MLTSIDEFLRWFDGVHRRTLRDLALLPREAETWRPAVPGDDESAWGIPQLVAHLAEAKVYFASAFLGRGWVWDRWDRELPAKEDWAPALEQSMETLRSMLAEAPDDALTRRIEMIAAPDKKMSAWRTLTMMAEHEVAHRSQIATYAGLNGWPVAQIFDRDNEWVVAQREEQLSRYR